MEMFLLACLCLVCSVHLVLWTLFQRKESNQNHWEKKYWYAEYEIHEILTSARKHHGLKWNRWDRYFFVPKEESEAGNE